MLPKNLRNIYSIDTLRVFAILAVICIHTEPFCPEKMINPTIIDKYLYCLINGTARFAVPYFFIVSGYFFAISSRSYASPLVRWRILAVRIGLAYIFWVTLYSVIPQKHVREFGLIYALTEHLNVTLTFLITKPIQFLVSGNRTPLWFLSSLIISSGLVVLLISIRKSNYIIPIGVMLYIIGLFGQGYAYLFSLSAIMPNTREGPFFGTLLFALGWDSAKNQKISLRVALLYVIVGFLIQFVEIILLKVACNAPIEDYYFGTIPLCFGLLHAALARPTFGSSTFLPSLGQLTLGVYGVHLFVARILNKIGDLTGRGAVWQICFPLAVYLISSIIALGGSKIANLKRFFC